MKKKTFICDHCEQEFEEWYKCIECSDKVIVEEMDIPGSGHYDEGLEEYIWTGNVCGNCCNCLYKNDC